MECSNQSKVCFFKTKDKKCKFELFHRLSGYTADKQPFKIPDELWPLSKLWLK